MFISKKNLMAAAAIIACGAPMLAQAQTNVTVYGRMYPQINSWSMTGATAATQPATDRSSLNGAPTGVADSSGVVMQSSNSKLGFRGTEDLGGDLKALFQLEMAFDVSDGTTGTALWGQNTFVGLEGSFGTVRLGRLDTVYKSIGDKMGFFGISSGNFISGSNILSKQPFGSGGQHRFHERLNNTIYYESPEFAGFKAELSYALGEVPDAVSSGTVVSGGVSYNKGPFYAALAHEQHNDYFGASRNLPTSMSNTIGGTTPPARTGTPTPGASSEDTATRLTLGYRITPNTRVGADFAVTELKETGGTAGRFESYKHNSWLVAVHHRIGALQLAANYGQANEGSCTRVGGTACSTAGLDGTQWTLGSYYSLSKRTGLFAVYGEMINGHSATRSNLDSDIGRPAPGQDIRQIAVGIDHSF